MRFHEFKQVTEGVNDPHIFKAVFMAGAPGAGKTTIANKLFGGTGLKLLNVDDFYNLIRTKGTSNSDPSKDYSTAWEKYKKREENYLDGRLGLIIDGTAKNANIQQKLKQDLEDLGYEVAMVFVNTPLEKSIERASQRARKPGKDFGRFTSPEFVKDVWNRVQSNIATLQNIFGERFYVVTNDENLDLSYVEKSLRNWLSKPPKNQKAREWIKANKKGA